MNTTMSDIPAGRLTCPTCRSDVRHVEITPTCFALSPCGDHLAREHAENPSVLDPAVGRWSLLAWWWPPSEDHLVMEFVAAADRPEREREIITQVES